MAVSEQEIVPEVVREISIPISREQEEALARAASVSGLSVEEFAVYALRAAEETVLNQVLPPAVEKRTLSAAEGFANDVKWSQFLRSDKEDRRVEIEQLALEADTEDWRG